MTRRCWNENCVRGPTEFSSDSWTFMSTGLQVCRTNPTHFPWWFRLVHLPHNLPISRHLCTAQVLRKFFFSYQKTSSYIPSWGGQDISNLLQVEGGWYLWSFHPSRYLKAEKSKKTTRVTSIGKGLPQVSWTNFGPIFCWGGIKLDWLLKFMVILEGFPLVHCLGWCHISWPPENPWAFEDGLRKMGPW